MADPLLDHIVLAAPDLDKLVAEFRERTGINPTLGGRHDTGGTRNYLVKLGDTSYLELIGPDVPGDSIPLPTAFGIDQLTAPRIAGWMTHPVDIEATVTHARAAGYEPGEIGPLARKTPEGTLLSWRLTRDAPDNFGGLVPGLIDWLESPHPSSQELPLAPLVSFTAQHPDPDAVRAAIAAVGAELPVELGSAPTLTLTIETPRGTVSLW